MPADNQTAATGNNRIEPTLNPNDGIPADASPEEREAAQAGNETGLLDQLQADLAGMQAKNAELAEQFLRAQADMQNTRRRAEEEIAKTRKFAVESFAESLLPVLDSLEASFAHKDATREQMQEGSEATLRQLKSVLERNKVVEINPAVGARFDPHQQQAISVAPLLPDSTQEPNTVVSVLQKGYLIAERVLRPALVIVSAGK